MVKKATGGGDLITCISLSSLCQISYLASYTFLTFVGAVGGMEGSIDGRLDGGMVGSY